MKGRLLVWLARRADSVFYALGKFFNGLIITYKIYYLKPINQRLIGPYLGNITLIRGYRFMELNAQHLELFGEEMRGPFESHFELHNALNQLRAFERAVFLVLHLAEGRVPEEDAREAMRLAWQKLPIPTQFVRRELGEQA